jgi:secreted PhoX family phosphatase
MKAVGVSVVRVKSEGGQWQVVMDPRNRRIDATTECELTGPARGSAEVFGATTVRGCVGNCSGGQTPWGTLLTCEENVDDYQETWGSAGYNAMHQGWVTEIDPRRRRHAQKA